ALPRARMAEPLALRAADPAGDRVRGDRRLGRCAVGLRALDGRALARDLHDQLARAPLRQPALRHRRRQPEQLVPGAAHPGRGLAQQPPLVHGVRAQRLHVVGDRPDVLRAARARRRGDRVGPARGAGARPAPRARRYSTRIVAFTISSFSLVLPELEPDASSFLSTSIPFTTSPNTVCTSFRCGVGPKVMKNWLPSVPGPRCAIDSIPALSCRADLSNSPAYS